MSSLDFDIDSHRTRLELEWRRAFEAGTLARADVESLQGSVQPDAGRLHQAVDRLQRAEAQKARILLKIDRLEVSALDS